MPVAVLDEAMLREPRLLLPGRQPAGPVSIDDHDPLAAGLAWFWLPSRRNDNRIIRTTSGGTIALTLAQGSTSPEAVGGYGVGERLSSNAFFNIGTGGITAHPMTVGVVGVTHSLGAIQSLYSWGNTGASANFGHLRITAGAALVAAERNTTEYRSQAPGVVVAGLPFTAIGRWASTTSRIAGLDGALGPEATGSADAANGTPRLGNTSKSAATDYFLGSYLFVAYWTRALTDAELIAWMRDPYQFLVAA